MMLVIAEGIYFLREVGEEAAMASPLTYASQTGQFAGCTHKRACTAVPVPGRVSEGREAPAGWEPKGLLTPGGCTGQRWHPAQAGAEHTGEP